MAILVDDHTSQLKLNYSCSNYDPKLLNHSNIFGKFGTALIRMLGKYMSEVSMPPVPMTFTADDNRSAEEKIFQLIQEKVNAGGCTNITLNNSAIELIDASSSFHVIKMDIYKAIYDYLLFTCIDKFFVFYIDPSDVDNVREMQKLSSVQIGGQNNKMFKPKNLYNSFRLCDINSNEQFKSTLLLRCFKFVPLSVEFADN
jgi:hypothetical protein